MRSGRDGGEDTSPGEAEQGAGQPGTKKNCISHKNRIFDLFSLLSYEVQRQISYCFLENRKCFSVLATDHFLEEETATGPPPFSPFAIAGKTISPSFSFSL